MMRNVNIPTTKQLEERLAISADRAKKIREALENWKNGGETASVLMAANLHLRGLGVKTLLVDPETPAAKAGQTLCRYVDRNDPKRATLIFDNRLENFKVLRLGDFLSRQGIED